MADKEELLGSLSQKRPWSATVSSQFPGRTPATVSSQKTAVPQVDLQ